MTYAREQINGTSGQDLNKINENFMAIWSKVFGDISFSDASAKLQETILTQYIPFQGEGNVDTNYSCTIRFYVPPNVKKVKASSMSAYLDNYRMDSATTSAGGKTENLDITISTSNAGGGTFQTHASSCSTSFSGSTTSYVNYWGNGTANLPLVPAPTRLVQPSDLRGKTWTSAPYRANGQNWGAIPAYDYTGEDIKSWVDLAYFQHCHSVSISGTVTVPGQTGSVLISPHSHDAVGKVTIPPHQHENEPGIKIATNIGEVGLYVNGNNIKTLSASSRTANDIDITDYITIGTWNTIECKCAGLGRIVVYGTVTCVMKSI